LTKRNGEWAGLNSDIARAVDGYCAERLAAYRESHRDVLEHVNMERAAVEGGYGRRQLFELVQNGADELLETTGKIHVVLTQNALYCANEGKPLSVRGVGALLSSHLSPKKGVEIGRFGLGFKSVLAITTCPEVFSRSGSIAFDPNEAAERIRMVVPEAEQTPVLRIASAIDVAEAAAEDETLAELMSWATTVIRLRRDTPDSSWLPEDLKQFPAEFLLFSPHVAELILEDRENDRTRTIASHEADGEFVLAGDDGETRWRVFSVEHTLSDEARLDAGAMAERDRIPIVWAVPTRGAGRGEFWAFFPISDRTTLSGVVNAPWKLSDDRTTMIPGPFNDELVHRASLLVLDHLEVLCRPDDPGVLLELMPARGREALSWADEKLSDYVNDLARSARSAPNQIGALMFPSEVSLHPNGLPRPTLQLWSEQPTRPEDWAHPTVEGTIRRARIEMYMAPRGAETIAGWLEALIPADEPLAGSIAALMVASAVARFDPAFLGEIRAASLFLGEDGKLRPATGLFRGANHTLAVEAEYINAELQGALSKEQLETLGISEVDPVRLLEVKLRQLHKESAQEDWDDLWTLVRECGATGAVQTIQSNVRNPLALKARTCAREYRQLSQLLLPGETVDDDPGEDARCVVDTRFHMQDIQVLRHLGVPSGPTREGGSRAEPWFIAYRRDAETSYLERLAAGGATPNRELLDFHDRPFAGPLTPLQLLKPAAASRYTAALLKKADDLEPWTYRHTSMTKYPEHLWDNPVVHMLKRKGWFRTELGIHTADTAVGPGLSDFAGALPVADDVSTEVASLLGLPNSVDELRVEDWQRGSERILQTDDDRLIGRFYAAAAAAGQPAPPELRCRIARGHDCRAASSVTVSNDPDLLAVLDKTGEPYIRVASESERDLLLGRWGLLDAAATVRSEVVSTPNGEPEALGDKFPMLRAKLSAEQRELMLQPCDNVRIERFTANGRIGENQELAVEPPTIHYVGGLDDRRLLRLIDQKLSIRLGDSDIDAILRNLDAKRVRQLRSEIRKAPDDATRMLLAVGVDELRARIPRAALDAVAAFEGELDDYAIAELSLTVHGPRALQEHKEILEERGLEPPYKWAGMRNAVSFVRELGFGIEYAGFESRTPDRQEEVEGPPDIGQLHDFQRIVVAEIRELIQGKDGRRGLLSLPTGAGKTRVTIEGLIDALASGDLASPILWIAQTEELCEQAVDTWSELWRGKGPRERLTISRLFASFEASEAERGSQVVVATDAKLDRGVFEKSTYDWLKKASCIVVDEAHTSVGPSYTRMLEWQGLGARQKKEEARDIPLIGLTATPFRGTNTVETQRLVARYGGRRLDLSALGSADAYPELQRVGILAQVDHELLPGSDIKLNKSEFAELNKLHRLPDTATRKLAADNERNRTLLDHIGELPTDWPVLLFGVSVDHAHAMAALLRRAGISAAAITADTDKGARRHYVEQFRSGELRVLSNYNVLAAGFDAPKVRALYIARPTYVPNAYQQMIGRGLRGPRNGGTERCLLVNVADNVERFEHRLAFHEFDYLWETESPEVPV
jgi:superfamily II DNA or RNA helicase